MAMKNLKKKKSETKYAKMGVKDTNKVCMPSLGMKINAYSSGFFFIAESIKVLISGIYFLWSSKHSSLRNCREAHWFCKLWFSLCEPENIPMKCISLKPETFFQCFLLQRWPINPWLLSRKIFSDLLLFAFSTNALQAETVHWAGLLIKIFKY